MPLGAAVIWAVVVMQGGSIKPVHSDGAGFAVVPVEGSAGESVFITASHPDARTRAIEVRVGSDQAFSQIELARFSPTDNPRYHFQAPGGGSPRVRSSNSESASVRLK